MLGNLIYLMNGSHYKKGKALHALPFFSTGILQQSDRILELSELICLKEAFDGAEKEKKVRMPADWTDGKVRRF